MTEEPIRPQRPTDERAEVDSVEWLFEPDWPGERLVARVRHGAVALTDIGGAAVDRLPDAVALLSRAVRAGSATLEGVWTVQPPVDDAGASAEREAFVATDLLELEGEPLLDVPFQERRRLLLSVVEEGLQVRVGRVVKQPIGGWLAGWRQAGFSHYLARHQNARCHPGEVSDTWLRIPLEPLGAAPGPGLLRRIIGGRGGTGPRRIRD